MAPRRVAGLVCLCAMAGVDGCTTSSVPPVPAAPAVVTPASNSAASCDPPSGLHSAILAKQAPEPTWQLDPKTLTLGPDDPGIQLLVVDPDARNGQRDLTASVAWSVAPNGILTIDSGGYVRAIAPGRAEVQAVFAGHKASAAITVADRTGRSWSFAEDIVPIFTRAGCNTGGCHGKADGQNGFHLSLFGYDASGDLQALTRDSTGRRVSRLQPDQSLFLLKATGRVPHGGGQRILAQSPEYQTLAAWIAAGAPERFGASHGDLKRVEVEPAEIRLDEPGPQQVRVIAHFADGHRRDVTRLAGYRVNDDSAARIDPKGHIVLLRRAETDLVVRYQSQVVSTRLATVINPGSTFDFAKLRRRNFIDDELFKRLASLKVPPSPPASDAAFLRRVSLDLTGEQPEPDRIKEFFADKDPEKRVKAVDALLKDPNFVKSWRIKFGDMLQISTNRLGNGAPQFQAWIDDCLRKNVPWDGMVRTMLTALGKIDSAHGPANYALDGPDAKTRAEQTAQRFLALRFRCAQCHDHPFDVWTQDDYFGFAAFFAKAERNVGAPGRMAMENVVKINPKGQVEHLRTKKPAEPRLLDKQPVKVAENDDPRKALADWMTRDDNPFFARAMANWVWAQFFGKGIADPPDDLSRANPPVHPELLDALAKHFIKHKYDLRELIRTIAVSEAYGLSSATVPGNAKDTRLFSHQIPRPLSAHQMADALAQATGRPNLFPNRSKRTKAIEVPDPSTTSMILDTFGRCPRNIGCASVSTPPLSLRQSLLLIGGDVIESKVSHLEGYLSSLLQIPDIQPEDIIENLYFRTVCRPPTAEESSRWSAELKQAASLREAAEDLFWALLNSREFAFNH